MSLRLERHELGDAQADMLLRWYQVRCLLVFLVVPEASMSFGEGTFPCRSAKQPHARVALAFARQERGWRLVEFCKLWLFDNRLSDAGAAAVAALVHGGLTEVHLSHNSITAVGACCAAAEVLAGRSVCSWWQEEGGDD